MRVKSTFVSYIHALWILILLGLGLWSVCQCQLALGNLDVMENPPPVPVRGQKYWRLHLHTWYHALSSGQRGRVAQHLRFAKSLACPLPKSNLCNVVQWGLPQNRSFWIKAKTSTTTTELNWPVAAGSNYMGVYKTICITKTSWISWPCNNPARDWQENSLINCHTEGIHIFRYTLQCRE